MLLDQELVSPVNCDLDFLHDRSLIMEPLPKKAACDLKSFFEEEENEEDNNEELSHPESKELSLASYILNVLEQGRESPSDLPPPIEPVNFPFLSLSNDRIKFEAMVNVIRDEIRFYPELCVQLKTMIGLMHKVNMLNNNILDQETKTLMIAVARCHDTPLIEFVTKVMEDCYKGLLPDLFGREPKNVLRLIHSLRCNMEMKKELHEKRWSEYCTAVDELSDAIIDFYYELDKAGFTYDYDFPPCIKVLPSKVLYIPDMFEAIKGNPVSKDGKTKKKSNLNERRNRCHALCAQILVDGQRKK